MNWDRVRAENRMARSMDYSERMDESDARADLDAVFDAIRYAEKARRSQIPQAPGMPPATGSPPAAPKVPLVPPVGTPARRRLEAEAALKGVTPAVLFRRGVSTTSSPVVKPGKEARELAHAAQLGVPVKELQRQRRETAAADRALCQQAVALGTTVKKLAAVLRLHGKTAPDPIPEAPRELSLRGFVRAAPA